jgi:lipoprotein NlpD
VPTYTVKRGDTLHQIALDSGPDYRELAAWNNLENANVIRVGQVLRLAAPGTTADPNASVTAQEVAPGVTTAPLRAPPAVVAAAQLHAAGLTARQIRHRVDRGQLERRPGSVLIIRGGAACFEREVVAACLGLGADAAASHRASAKPAEVEPKPEPRPAPPAAPATSGDADALDWAWPAKGRIIAGFSETANLKGIDIAGTAGQAVNASAAGRVVYAGTGLRGYGKLIIIKHNATFLSAYAHNREILVKEGQQVARGQKIAEMGNTDADQVKLHFEIRRQGKPMDPAKYLPPA